jgi:LacI family transcriptional regulator
LLVETSHGYGRDLLAGVIRYLRQHGPWSLYFRPQGLEAAPPQWLSRWRGDGVLVRVEDYAMAQAVYQTGLPAVNLRVPFSDFPLPVVGMDNLALGEIGFRHLSDRGFKHFGFCGTPPGTYAWHDERRQSFEQSVRASGGACHTFTAVRRRKQLSWEEEEDQIASWIRSLPKPVGIMACGDERGVEVLEACRRANVQVPDEVALIGVDNDEFICTFADPPMSSISANAEQIGYEAASLLDRLMAGGSPPNGPLLLPPGSVVTRRSTDVLATEDRQLAAAIRYIREHACEGLRLKELLRVMRLPRRSFERRVQALLGRSPKQEISRVQIERAKQLLMETDLSAAAIAEKCGFSQAKYFSQVFHAKVGLPPGVYRKQQEHGLVAERET